MTAPETSTAAVTGAPAAVEGSIIITAYGSPVTQGSIRSLGAGRPSVHSNAKRLKPWRQTVHEAALDAMRLHDRLDGPVQVRLLFCLDRPMGHYGRGRNAGTVRGSAPRHPATRSSGDIDKLSRSCLDSLVSAGVMVDDSQVVDLRARKTWAGGEDALPIPGVRIEVRTVLR